MDQLDAGFIESSPIAVINREREGVTNNHPAVDYEIIEHLGINLDNFVPGKPSSLLTELLAQDPERKLHELKSKFGNINLTPAIEKARGDKTALSRANERRQKRKLSIGPPPHTRELLTAAEDFMAVNNRMEMNSNEWLDVFHMVVPTAYLDFVLLDKRWCEFIRQQNFPEGEIAKVYSRKGISDFLNDLRDFESQSSATA